jgi:putative tricarboxylic transport membrane protein
MTMQRRQILARSAAMAALLTPLAPAALAQATAPRPGAPAPKAAKVAGTLRIVIPANPGGGWDQTGRALGAALKAVGAADQVEFENIGGKGGTIGLAKYAEKYGNDANTLLMGGMVMVGAVALQKPAVDMGHIQPIARLTSDYLVTVVPAASAIKSGKDLADAMRGDLPALPVAGGSAGGVDHIYAGVLARAAKAKPEALVYRPFASGTEVVESLLKGDAAVGISGYSEFSDALAAGKLRAIGVSARRSAFGIPAFKDQGIDAVMANWRGVFTGKGVSPARTAELLAAVEQATHHESWLQTLKQNRWEASWLAGKDLTEFMELDLTTARVMVYLLKLKA